MLGMICTQYKRHFLVCPRAISTQIEPDVRIGTEAMACRTVSVVGPSELLHVSGGGDGVGGDAPHPAPAVHESISMTIS